MIAKHGNLSGFIESLYVENGQSKVKAQGSPAHKRMLLQFNDGTYGIYDSRVTMYDSEVAYKVSYLDIGNKKVIFAVNLDTGMADDTRIYDRNAMSYQIGHTSQPVGTNRIAIYQESTDK